MNNKIANGNKITKGNKITRGYRITQDNKITVNSPRVATATSVLVRYSLGKGLSAVPRYSVAGLYSLYSTSLGPGTRYSLVSGTMKSLWLVNSGGKGV